MKVVLIGGRNDGKRMDVDVTNEVLVVPVDLPMFYSEPVAFDKKVILERYYISYIMCDRARLYFARHEKLTDHEALIKLLLGYKNPDKRF